MPEPILSVVVPCMGRLHHLKLSTPALLAQPEIEYILVDYSCPDRCGDYARTHWPRAQVVEVPGQQLFNLSRARNAGIRAATCPYLAVLDADNVVSLDFAREVVRLLAVEDRLMLRQFMSGLLICRRSQLDRVGLYHEAFQGWGVEDDEMFQRLLLAGVRQVCLPRGLLGVLEHPDTDRVRHYREKDIWKSSQRNGALVAFRIGKEARRAWPDPVTFHLVGSGFGAAWKSVQYACYVQRLHRLRVRLYSWWHESMTPYVHGERLSNGAGLLREILDALDTPVRPDIIEDGAPDDIQPPGASTSMSFPYCPTRTRWRGWHAGLRRRIAYQLEPRRGAPMKSPLWDEIHRLLGCGPDFEFVPLGKHLSVQQCVEAAAASDLFVGLDSGMVQLCYSVGVPVLLIDDRDDVNLFFAAHGSQPGIQVDTAAECAALARCFLGLGAAH